MKGRLAAALGVVALLSVPTTALAQTAGITPAPPGSAEAVAAELEGIVAIAHTQAEANQSSGTATANALELLGSPPLSQVGGTQTGAGTSQGALLDTGENPDFRVAVLPWSAAVTQGSTNTSLARAALARLVLGDLVTLNVLQSESRASHAGLTSTGDGSSDGVTLDLLDGALDIVLLHSEAHSTGEGETFIISINDTKLLTQDQLGDACNIEIPSLLKVVCLTVAGGVGSVASSAANVGAVQDAVKSNVVSSVGSGQPNAVQAQQVGGGGGDGGGPGTLPATGSEIMKGVVYGFALLLLGGLILAAQKTRERMALRAV